MPIVPPPSASLLSRLHFSLPFMRHAVVVLLASTYSYYDYLFLPCYCCWLLVEPLSAMWPGAICATAEQIDIDCVVPFPSCGMLLLLSF